MINERTMQNRALKGLKRLATEAKYGFLFETFYLETVVGRVVRDKISANSA